MIKRKCVELWPRPAVAPWLPGALRDPALRSNELREMFKYGDSRTCWTRRKPVGPSASPRCGMVVVRSGKRSRQSTVVPGRRLCVRARGRERENGAYGKTRVRVWDGSVLSPERAACPGWPEELVAWLRDRFASVPVSFVGPD